MLWCEGEGRVMKETEKKQKMSVVQIMGLIIFFAIALFMLFVDVLAAEGYFGDPAEWTNWDSRDMRRVCGAVAIAVLFLTGHELPRKRKPGEIEGEESESDEG